MKVMKRKSLCRPLTFCDIHGEKKNDPYSKLHMKKKKTEITKHTNINHYMHKYG